MAVFYVLAGNDDCYRRLTNSVWSLTANYIFVGYNTPTNKQWGGGMRFAGITIPRDSTILTAKLTLQADATYADQIVRSRISAEAEDNPAAFTDSSAAFDTRWANRTATRVDWDDIEPFTADLNYDSVDFAAVIQEIIDRGGWNSGQAIVIFWEDFDDRSDAEAIHFRSIKTFENPDNAPPKLTITYTEPTGIGSKSANMGSKMLAAGLI